MSLPSQRTLGRLPHMQALWVYMTELSNNYPSLALINSEPFLILPDTAELSYSTHFCFRLVPRAGLSNESTLWEELLFIEKLLRLGQLNETSLTHLETRSKALLTSIRDMVAHLDDSYVRYLRMRKQIN